MSPASLICVSPRPERKQYQRTVFEFVYEPAALPFDSILEGPQVSELTFEIFAGRRIIHNGLHRIEQGLSLVNFPDLFPEPAKLCGFENLHGALWA